MRLQRQQRPDGKRTVEQAPGEKGLVAEQVRRYTGSESDEQQPTSSPAANLATAGEHVVSVLAAAEAAAEKLQREAEQDAARTRQQAAAEAEELRARVLAETEDERSNALQLVRDAEAKAATLRENAETFAQRRHREAEEAAARIVEAAEQRSDELEQAAAARQRTLLSNISSSEERMSHLATNLHDVASQLAELAANRLSLQEDAEEPLRAEAEAVVRTGD